jgi:putative DNA methylase
MVSIRGGFIEPPRNEDYSAANAATRALEGVPKDLLPDEQIPPTERRRISLPIYGMERWGDLFTARQKMALLTLCRLVGEVGSKNSVVAELLAMNISRAADYSTSLCSWKNTTEKLNHTFGRQALPMMWDFAEVNLSGDTAANLSWIARVAERQGQAVTLAGQVQMADACHHPLPDESADLWFTDPPYYDSVPYAHLADFFYLWLQRSITSGAKRWFQTPLTPKEGECVVDRPHALSSSKKTPAYFERKLGDAMQEGRRVLKEDGVGCVVFAHKTTEGWEALLSGMVSGGWTVTASWPVSTEMGTRLTARDTASLAASVHLVCRPRPDDAKVGDWSDVFRELPKRVGDWMDRLQGEGVRGADLVFACIGPALEIFSRYSKVETADGREVPLPEYLEKVWEVVGRTALQQVLGTAEGTARNGVAGALEEDARLTALFLWTLQATEVSENGANGQRPHPGPLPEGEGEDDEDDEDEVPRSRGKGFTLIFDVVRRFAQPLGIHLPDWEDRIIKTEKGVVRLIPVLDRAEQLFGEAGASLAADRIEADAQRDPQATFDFMAQESAAPKIKGRGKRKPSPQPSPGGRGEDMGDESLRHHRGATTLDRVHAAMLLQSSGRAHALRALLKSEIDRGPDFMRLANALSALSPAGSDEKRLLDAMLLAVPR